MIKKKKDTIEALLFLLCSFFLVCLEDVFHTYAVDLHLPQLINPIHMPLLIIAHLIMLF